MIAATKYLNLNTCVLNVTAHIIELLQANGAMKFGELLDKVTSKLGEGARYEFQQAISFLFLLGRIEYSEEADAFHLGQEAEAFRPGQYTPFKIIK